LSYGDKSHILI